MDYAGSILELVGNTPLVRLTRVTRELGPLDRQPLILAKLETLNPGGSVKDRIGLPMIEAAERAGLLRPGGTIIEPTSGNTGHGLAIAAALKGYRCIFVMADKQSARRSSSSCAPTARRSSSVRRTSRPRAPRATTAWPPGSLATSPGRSSRTSTGTRRTRRPTRRRPDPSSGARPTAGSVIWWPASGPAARSAASPTTSSGRTRRSSSSARTPRAASCRVTSARPYLTEGIGEDFLPGDARPGGRRPLGPSLGPRLVRGRPPAHARGGHPRRRVERHGARRGPRRGPPDHGRGPGRGARSGSSWSSCRTAVGRTSPSSTTTNGCGRTGSWIGREPSAGSSELLAGARSRTGAAGPRRGPDDPARRRGDRDAPGLRDQPDAGVRGARRQRPRRDRRGDLREGPARSGVPRPRGGRADGRRGDGPTRSRSSTPTRSSPRRSPS